MRVNLINLFPYRLREAETSNKLFTSINCNSLKVAVNEKNTAS